MKFKQKFGWMSHIFGQNWIVPRYQNTGRWVSDLQKSKMQYSRPCVCNLVPDPPPPPPPPIRYVQPRSELLIFYTYQMQKQEIYSS